MDMVLQLALAIAMAATAIILHELAHGYAALALGDETALHEGRLSLNPLRHVDRFGTLLLPGILLASQLLTVGRVVFMFGWAKPVPVAAWKFRNPRRGMALVAMAGPAMNFFLAWLAALVMLAVSPGRDGFEAVSEQFLVYFMLTNLVLGLFNLLPIPPLDGGRIAVGLLPLEIAKVWAKLERAGIVIVLLAVFVLPHLLGFDPVGDALDRILPWAFRVIFWLAGHNVNEADGTSI
jgi:Zn-dependent protease